MTKHTSGRWSIRKIVEGCRSIASGPMKAPIEICRIVEENKNAGFNAQLIVRSPELLKENERLKAENAELIEELEKSDEIEKTLVEQIAHEIENRIPGEAHITAKSIIRMLKRE